MRNTTDSFLLSFDSTFALFCQISSDSERDEEVAAVLCQGVMSVTASSPIQLSPQLEENYMPMTPRKKGSPDTSCQPETLQSVSPTHDESPYVEMTQKEGKTRWLWFPFDQISKLIFLS